MTGEKHERLAQERFWAKVDRSGGPDACWPWTASTFWNGYGQFRYRGRLVKAHRFAIGAAAPTPGLEACHSCNNPACCNPRHLRLATHAENMAEMVSHGRAAKQEGELHGMSKLTEQAVRAIRRGYSEGGTTQRKLARSYGISQRQVLSILHRRTWKHVKDEE